MKVNVEKKVVVITPTIGTPKLAKAVRSVQAQSYSNVEHLIVGDGPKIDITRMGLKNHVGACSKEITIVNSPHNTGGDGFYGHRIYAGYPHLINCDYVFFLDEDNWYREDHVESLVATIEAQNYDFAHSLRTVVSVDEKEFVQDNCESLGKYPIWFTQADPQYLIDTSSYAFKREFLIKVSQLWHSGWGGDRRFLQLVKIATQNQVKFGSTGKYSLYYRLSGNPNSVTMDFFHQGNKHYDQQYGGKFPWKI